MSVLLVTAMLLELVNQFAVVVLKFNTVMAKANAEGRDISKEELDELRNIRKEAVEKLLLVD